MRKIRVCKAREEFNSLNKLHVIVRGTIDLNTPRGHHVLFCLYITQVQGQSHLRSRSSEG